MDGRMALVLLSASLSSYSSGVRPCLEILVNLLVRKLRAIKLWQLNDMAIND